MLCISNFRPINFRFNFLLEIKALLLSAEKNVSLLRSSQSMIDMSSKNFDLMIENLINNCVNHCDNLMKYSSISFQFCKQSFIVQI